MTERLPGDVLAVLRDAREVRIETRPAPDVPPHRTPIWVVVDDQDRAFIRTFRGPKSRWYREALAAGTVGMEVDGQRFDVTVEHVKDDERIEACSQAMRSKYNTSRASLAAMLLPEVLPTTLELHPVAIRLDAATGSGAAPLPVVEVGTTPRTAPRRRRSRCRTS